MYQKRFVIEVSMAPGANLPEAVAKLFEHPDVKPGDVFSMIKEAVQNAAETWNVQVTTDGQIVMANDKWRGIYRYYAMIPLLTVGVEAIERSVRIWLKDMPVHVIGVVEA